MTGPTHRQYSICFACIASMLIYKYNISSIDYFAVLIITIMTSKCGARFPDVDHDWRNVHDKSAINKIINILIHITGGKHRSWQTHSWDICIIFTFLACFLPYKLFTMGIFSEVNKEVWSILLVGFATGWISHLFSDMLTSGGVRLLCFSKVKVKLVPKQIFKLKFNTGNEWENFNYKLMRVLNVILGIISIIYPFVESGIITLNFK